jgi:hypothetical protein
MDPVPGLFVIWEGARSAEERILADIRANFDVVFVKEMEFPCRPSEGYRRFYQETLPDEWRKVRACGTGPFLVVVVRDRSPELVPPERRDGNPAAWRNRRFIDFKEKYRGWTGRNHRVHSTMDDYEFARDIRRLTGRTASEWAGGVPAGDLRIDLPPLNPALVRKSFVGRLLETIALWRRRRAGAN